MKSRLNGNKITLPLAAAVIALAASSCATPKTVAYFQDNAEVVEMAAPHSIAIKPGDKLYIVVKTKDPAVSELFNQPIYGSRVGTNDALPSGTGVSLVPSLPSNDGIAMYTVTPEGYIDFPVLGMLRVEGLTRAELSGMIKGELIGRDLVKDPTVTVEFVANGINVMGEVARPGRYDINKDRVTVLDALSLAGDLTIKGQRKDVKVVRQEDGKLRVYSLDLTDLGKLAQSPAYYMQQNDVIYVQPNDMRKRETTVNGNNTLSTSFWISVVSLITSAVTTIGVFVK